jgi:hypothetical protein
MAKSKSSAGSSKGKSYGGSAISTKGSPYQNQSSTAKSYGKQSKSYKTQNYSLPYNALPYLSQSSIRPKNSYSGLQRILSSYLPLSQSKPALNPNERLDRVNDAYSFEQKSKKCHSCGQTLPQGGYSGKKQNLSLKEYTVNDKKSRSYGKTA